jgi:hypothetical protein
VKLIDGIEELLKKRAELVEMLVVLRRGMSGKISAVHALCSRRSMQAIDLSERVKLDWNMGAAAAEQKIRDQRRERYQRKKLQTNTQHGP